MPEIAVIGRPDRIDFVADLYGTGENFRIHRRMCVSACNFGSDAVLVQLYSFYSDQPGLKQIDIAASVHLAPDELKTRDLTFCLSVGPRQRNCGSDRGG